MLCDSSGEAYLQRFLVHGDLRLQACEVEVILDKVLRYLGKVFVPEQGAEGRNPGFWGAGRSRHGGTAVGVGRGKKRSATDGGRWVKV